MPQRSYLASFFLVYRGCDPRGKWYRGAPYNSSGDLAFIGGELFLSSSFLGDYLVKLSLSTGEGTLVGGIGFGAVYGLATDNNIDLYGLSGTSVLNINTTTDVGTLGVNYAGQGLVDAWGSVFFTESCTGGQCNPVPEPASLALMGLGLAGLGFVRRITSAASATSSR